MTVVAYCLLSVVTLCCLSLLMLWVVRRLVSPARLSEVNDISSAYFQLIGTIYAVLLAFVLVETWAQYSTVRRDGELEVAALFNVAQTVGSLPAEAGQPAREALRDYLQIVVYQDFPAMERGEECPAAVTAYRHLKSQALALPVKDEQSRVFVDRLLSDLTDAGRYHELRHMHARPSMPFLMWIVLAIGGAITLGFGCLFGVISHRRHALKICALAAMIAIVLYAIYEVDGAYQGRVKIEPTSHARLLDEAGLQ